MLRAIISSPMLVASPQPAEAAAKITTPNKNINRRPKRSPNEPPTKISAARNNPYDSTTHCRSTTVARKLACSAGNATFTTALSINAKLDPSSVATRIHFRASVAHGPPPPAARITASSQAVLMPALFRFALPNFFASVLHVFPLLSFPSASHHHTQYEVRMPRFLFALALFICAFAPVNPAQDHSPSPTPHYLFAWTGDL